MSEKSERLRRRSQIAVWLECREAASVSLSLDNGSG